MKDQLSSIPAMDLAQQYIDGSVTDSWPIVSEPEPHAPLFTAFSDQADNVISAADEQEIEEARERWELSKLKKKYEVVAEKDEC